jgi:hypothetical protein
VALPMVNAMDVLAVRLPEVPVMVTVDVPTAAELLAVSVSALEAVAGLVPNDAVTPVGKPEAARVTLPVNPPVSATVIVSVPLPPGVTDKVEVEGESVKPVVITVMTNVCVLWHELASVYVATKLFVPVLNGIPSSSRAVEAKSLGPVQLHVPTFRGCGPRFTLDPEVTVTLAACCQAAPFTWR